MRRGSQIMSTPRSVSSRIKRPAPCLRLIIASGNWWCTKPFIPFFSMAVMRAASTGSSGGEKGNLSIITSDNASPRTSTPSQKLWLPISTPLPAARKRSSNSVRPASPWINKGKFRPSFSNSSLRRSAENLTAFKVVQRRNVLPPAAAITGNAAVITASA